MALSYISFMLLKSALFEDAQNLFFLSQPLTPERKKALLGVPLPQANRSALVDLFIPRILDCFRFVFKGDGLWVRKQK